MQLQGFALLNDCSDEASESRANQTKDPRLMQRDMGAGWHREMPQSIPQMLHADQGFRGSPLRSRLLGNGNELHLRLAASIVNAYAQYQLGEQEDGESKHQRAREP